VTIEFPAGLVDANESAADAAVRELKEETGFDATKEDVAHVGPMTGADPGKLARLCPHASSPNSVRPHSIHDETCHHSTHLPSIRNFCTFSATIT
jgi:8-oxo-dGTP pyrophosphatase MutT (NUDIX family)